MNVGIAILGSDIMLGKSEIDTTAIVKTLFKRGIDTSVSVNITSVSALYETLKVMEKSASAIIVCGETDMFYNAMAEYIPLDRAEKIFELEQTIYFVMPTYDESTLVDEIIPTLTRGNKTVYTTAVFATFGYTEVELRELLKDYIKNRNRITFSFFPSLLTCDVFVRYSSKMSKESVSDTLTNVSIILSKCCYANCETTLLDQVIDLLKLRKKRISIAESFTAGRLSAMLASQSGASEYLCEGIVCYSHFSKQFRLCVDKTKLEHYGAISDEIVYDMASGLLRNSECDLVLATTGNAGPTAEDDGVVGLCYIAVGDCSGIHIYKNIFDGDREQITQKGVLTALYCLYKALKSNRFQEMIQENYL